MGRRYRRHRIRDRSRLPKNRHLPLLRRARAIRIEGSQGHSHRRTRPDPFERSRRRISNARNCHLQRSRILRCELVNQLIIRLSIPEHPVDPPGRDRHRISHSQTLREAGNDRSLPGCPVPIQRVQRRAGGRFRACRSTRMLHAPEQQTSHDHCRQPSHLHPLLQGAGDTKPRNRQGTLKSLAAAGVATYANIYVYGRRQYVLGS